MFGFHAYATFAIETTTRTRQYNLCRPMHLTVGLFFFGMRVQLFILRYADISRTVISTPPDSRMGAERKREDERRRMLLPLKTFLRLNTKPAVYVERTVANCRCLNT